MKMLEIKKEIDDCEDCIHYTSYQDKGTGNVSYYCHHSDTPKSSLLGSSRACKYGCEIPDWCPLPEVEV